MLRIALALVVALSACSKKEAPSKPPAKKSDLGPVETPKITEGAEVVVTLSVDWEGAFLNEAGLAAIEAFRKEWKDTPITHFICPAYFTQGADNAAIAAKIKKYIREGDEVGLHIHSWHSLAKQAGVAPRDAPNFYADDAPLMTFEHSDKGYEVSISAYQGEEITKLIKSSLALLEENGLGRATSFRAGGHIGTPEVLAAVRSAGLLVDSSATWPAWFDPSRVSNEAAQGEDSTEEEVERSLSYTELKAMWPNIQELTQPYGIDTAAGPVTEVPNTGSFAEYARSDEMLGHLQRAMLASAERGNPIYVNFGFHQESAQDYIDSIADALYNFREQNPKVLRFSTITAVATKATGE